VVLPTLTLVFLIAPIVELYVIIQVAQVIGGWETIALLLLESFVGAWLIKRQGLSVWRRITEAVAAHRTPGKELVDAFLILVAGVLMLTPGFVTDVFGFLLLAPPVRALLRRTVTRRLVAAAGLGKVSGVFISGGTATRFGRSGGVHDATAREAGRGPDRELPG
jgi:UPF0716 protein FxsA